MYEKTIELVKENMGTNLLCAVKYGTEGEQNNLVFVFDKLDFTALEILRDVLLKKKEKALPLFFTKSELKNAADVFPLEFLDIQYPHEVLFGQDLVASLKIEKQHVRRELESELRSKLIHLRENYVRISKDKELRSLLMSAVPSLMPLFYGLLFLKNVTPPTELDILFKAVEEKYAFNLEILRTLKNLKDSKASSQDLKNYVEKLLVFLNAAITMIDKLDH